MMTRMEKYKDLRDKIDEENKEIQRILEEREENFNDLDDCIFGHLVTFEEEPELEDFREETIKSLLNSLMDDFDGIAV